MLYIEDLFSVLKKVAMHTQRLCLVIGEHWSTDKYSKDQAIKCIRGSHVTLPQYSKKLFSCHLLIYVLWWAYIDWVKQPASVTHIFWLCEPKYWAKMYMLSCKHLFFGINVSDHSFLFCLLTGHHIPRLVTFKENLNGLTVGRMPWYFVSMNTFSFCSYYTLQYEAGIPYWQWHVPVSIPTVLQHQQNGLYSSFSAPISGCLGSMWAQLVDLGVQIRTEALCSVLKSSGCP